ncbi:hypothetical protein [Rummeliibacillus stabekisii]|uniref:hypothetical protein n=1 Tax=Rummeliibacillus stabekisii TaxID=241244 RepID=UPI003717109C
MNRLNFRPEDWHRAETLHEKIDLLQNELLMQLEQGKYGAAEISTERMNLLIKQLCKMRHTKREHDRLAKVAETMNLRGIKSKVVARYV